MTAVTFTDAWLHQAVTAATNIGPAATRLVATSAVHLALLTFATVISVDKPWGRTTHARRRLTTRREIR